MRKSIVRIILLSAFILSGRVALAGDTERAKVQTVSGPGSGVWRVVDSNNQLVGTLLGADAVGSMIGGVSFLLQGVSSDGIPDTASNFTLFYVSSDCSGAPYGKPSSSGFFVDHIVIGNSLYYVPAGAPKSNVFSYRATDQMGQQACQQLMFPGSSGFSPYSIVPLTFAPPFRVVQ